MCTECGRPETRLRKGLCGACYMRGKRTEAGHPPKTPPPPCRICGGGPHVAKGLCGPCYAHAHYVRKPRPARKPCAREGCEKLSKARGLCPTHYRAMMRGPGRPPSLPCRICGGKHSAKGLCHTCYAREHYVPKPRKPRPRRLCAICGKPSVSKGLCSAHYQQARRKARKPQPKPRLRSSSEGTGW